MAIAEPHIMPVNPAVSAQAGCSAWGTTLDGRYTLRDCIAQGGMGRVYVAEQPALERTVAVKLLHPELAQRREYARCLREEAIAAGRIRSPHCVKVIDCGALPDGTPYLVMEHLQGRSLRDVIADEPISLARAADLVDQILTALRATHEAGIVHADVKSDNFLVETVDGKDHVTMIDFGLARLAGTPFALDNEHGETMVLGTPEYMAPEVVRGRPPIAASDLYGAGVILYELLTGNTPFTASTAGAIMRQHLQEVVVPPSLRQPDREIPPLVDRLVMKALDKRPEGRFPDARTFARALRECVRRSRAPSVPLPRPTRPDLAASASQAADGPPAGRLAQGSDCGASAHRVESLDALRPAIAEPRVLGAPPEREEILDAPPQRVSSSLKIVKKASRSATSGSLKPR
jgi:serine/threonine-protein kinase